MGQVKDWKKGECDPIPGKTMPLIKLVERDYGRSTTSSSPSAR
jgi:nitrate reductase alpha subunit